jgi:hypothetical protein
MCCTVLLWIDRGFVKMDLKMGRMAVHELGTRCGLSDGIGFVMTDNGGEYAAILGRFAGSGSSSCGYSISEGVKLQHVCLGS